MKIKTKYVWFRQSSLSNIDVPVLNHWDITNQEWRFLDESGYESEQDAVAALLAFVGDDIYQYDEFTLVKTYRVVEEDGL